MKISHTGSIIAAASKKVAKPFLQVGAIPVIRRIVITYQQAGIFPIVIITGSDNDEIKQQLTSYGVIFLKNEQDEQPELFESVKIGLSFLHGKCDRVVFTPVNVPMFTPTTLETLMQSEGSVVSPTYEGRGGHPVLISDDVIGQILGYEGENGLRGAFELCPDHRRIDVDDKGVIIADTGAYASLGGPVLHRACTHAAGPYNYQNIDIFGMSVYTNNVVSGAYRGFGVSQSCFATEMNINLLAEMVGIDPWEFRRRNAIKPGDVLSNGQTADPNTNMAACLDALKDEYYKHPYAGKFHQVLPLEDIPYRKK